MTAKWTKQQIQTLPAFLKLFPLCIPWKLPLYKQRDTNTGHVSVMVSVLMELYYTVYMATHIIVIYCNFTYVFFFFSFSEITNSKLISEQQFFFKLSKVFNSNISIGFLIFIESFHLNWNICRLYHILISYRLPVEGYQTSSEEMQRVSRSISVL